MFQTLSHSFDPCFFNLPNTSIFSIQAHKAVSNCHQKTSILHSLSTTVLFHLTEDILFLFGFFSSTKIYDMLKQGKLQSLMNCLMVLFLLHSNYHFVQAEVFSVMDFFHFLYFELITYFDWKCLRGNSFYSEGRMDNYSHMMEGSNFTRDNQMEV